jgi:hypothetical protein
MLEALLTGSLVSNRLLTKSTSGVLASLRGSTYGREYDFASSLAAALLDGLSEQPVRYSPDVRDFRQGSTSELVLGFLNTLLILCSAEKVPLQR